MTKRDALRGDVSRWLARMDSIYAADDFFTRLSEAASDDRSIHVAPIDRETVFVTGFHLSEKCTMRLGRHRHVIEARIAEVLRNPIVMPYLRQYPVYYDDSVRPGKVVGMEKEDGIEIKAVAVVDEAEGLVYILETGWDYCYLSTVLTYGRGGYGFNCGSYELGRVGIHRNTMIVSVSRSGFVRFGDTELVCRMSAEEEAKLLTKKSKARKQR